MGRLLIEKTALTEFPKKLQSLQRASIALKQGSGFKAVFEFPARRAADRAMDIMIEQGVTNIKVRVAN
ncbi:hypothetical protein [Metapseudomonas otitidis]|uniref:hypothetical protein n=1 Tax=Metapseudomonas otitidis TaxID=319939 RepID=UPI00261C83DD|nr:hypothetical protein [Pseudomonas otitidis]